MISASPRENPKSMDPLTHTLVGANLASTRLGGKTRLAGAALIIGANLPDVDSILYFTGHSELWVKAYLRTCASAGVPAAVVRRGDDDAGVVFIKVARLDGTAALYGPAPAGLERDSGEPRWLLAATASDADIETRLAREKNLDSDIWVVEIEDREGRHFLEGWLAPE